MGENIFNPVTGLSPERANFNGTPLSMGRSQNSASFAYDSWRTAANWSFDWSWWQKDPNEWELSNKLQKFFGSMGVTTYGSLFRLTGEVIDTHHRTGLVSANAVASLAATHALAKEFVEDFWNARIPDTFGDRYYDGTLYLMNLLQCSGEYKIWKPGKQ